MLGVTERFQQMTQHNVGALVVVKPGQDKSIAGIVTERGELLSKLCVVEKTLSRGKI